MERRLTANSLYVVLISSTTMLFGSYALAEDGELIQSCADEIAAHCGHVKSDKPVRKIRRCLKRAHAQDPDAFSEGCMTLVAERREERRQKYEQKVEAFAEPCREDVAKFCEGVADGLRARARARAVHVCLTQHEMELSEQCANHRRAVNEKVAKFREPCEDDVTQYCSHLTMRPRERRAVRRHVARVAACLDQNEANLSQECRQQKDDIIEALQAFAESCGDDIKAYCPNRLFALNQCLENKKDQLSETCQALFK